MYQLILRRFMAIIWEELKTESKFRVIFNASLSLKSKEWKEEEFYGKIIEHFRSVVKQIL